MGLSVCEFLASFRNHAVEGLKPKRVALPDWTWYFFEFRLPPRSPALRGGWRDFGLRIWPCLLQYLLIIDFFQSQFVLRFLLGQEGEELF